MKPSPCDLDPPMPKACRYPAPLCYAIARAVRSAPLSSSSTAGVANVALPTIARATCMSGPERGGVDRHHLSADAGHADAALRRDLASKIGLKRMYQLGQMIFTVATLLCFFAKSLPFLLVVRAGAGDRRGRRRWAWRRRIDPPDLSGEAARAAASASIRSSSPAPPPRRADHRWPDPGRLRHGHGCSPAPSRSPIALAAARPRPARSGAARCAISTWSARCCARRCSASSSVGSESAVHGDSPGRLGRHRPDSASLIGIRVTSGASAGKRPTRSSRSTCSRKPVIDAVGDRRLQPPSSRR